MAAPRELQALFGDDLAAAEALEAQAQLLGDMTAGFASSLNVGETLSNAIERFMAYLDAEAASIFLLENDGRELVCRECAGPVDIHGLRLDASRGIVGKTVRSRAAQMVRDVKNDPDFAASVDAGTGFVTRSILCAPLIARDEVIGALELINKRSGDGLFSTRDRYLVTAIAASAALAIHNARMAAALVEQERIRKELELAREIQLALLPAPAQADFPIAGINTPARAVSGDFYDFLRLADGRIYFSLGDVSGKGMNAALLMARTLSLLRLLAKRQPEPGALLAAVNDELCETSSRGMFVTLTCGFFDPAAGRVDLANAGHQPSLYRDAAGAWREFPAGAPPLGVVAGIEFPCDGFSIRGGCLCLYSDGVTEAVTSQGGWLEVVGLRRLLAEHTQGTPAERLDRIAAGIAGPGAPQRDDVTLMLIDGTVP